jgi:hypothetical protein
MFCGRTDVENMAKAIAAKKMRERYFI